MQTIEQITDSLKAKIALRRGTPEQIEQARRNAWQRNITCRVDCPICGGSGFLKADGARAYPCPNVSSLTLFPGDGYGISLEERDMTWDKLVRLDWLEPAIAAVQETLERGSGFVYLWGPFGTGKTTILKTAVAVSLNRLCEATYARLPEIFSHIRAAFDTSAPSYESQRRLDWWAELPVLAIDEFESANLTAYASELRFVLIDRRYENALRGRQSVTLIVSNNDPARLDGYLYDRIRDGRFRVVHIDGNSLRPVMER